MTRTDVNGGQKGGKGVGREERKEIKTRFIVEFQISNLEQQSCDELKEIKQMVGESAWEYD